MSVKKISIGLVGLLSLNACMGPNAMETEPVKVPTAKGDVYCQLYTHNTVAWDHSIRHPQDMSVHEADKICIDLGYDLLTSRRFNS